jgi:hypothetical protein
MPCSLQNVNLEEEILEQVIYQHDIVIVIKTTSPNAKELAIPLEE